MPLLFVLRTTAAILILALLASLLAAFALRYDGPAHPPTPTTPFGVMTFNVRYANPDDAPNDWTARRDEVAALMARADLIGVQEALAVQMADLHARLPGFDWFGVGRTDGKSEGEFSAIFYRTDRFDLLRHDTFWLSETPDVPGSVGWDAALERIATWGQLRDRVTGDTLYHVNTHFDHVGEQARRESARLLLGKIDRIAGQAPVVLTGDFNVVDSSRVYRILTGEASDEGAALSDARTLSAAAPEGPNSTWNAFETIEPGRRIDFIFTRPPVEVLRHTIIDARIPGTDRFPSDHLPVLVRARIAD